MKITQVWPYQYDEKKIVLDKCKRKRMVSAFLCALGITSGSVLAVSMISDPSEIEVSEVFFGAVCFTDTTVSGVNFMKQNHMVVQLKEEIAPYTKKKKR